MTVRILRPALDPLTHKPLRLPIPGANRCLLIDGEPIELDAWWRRRIADGGVVVVEPTKSETPKKTADKKE